MIDFIRPLGVPDAPHVGDLPSPATHEADALPNLSFEHEPADEHLANAIQSLRMAALLPDMELRPLTDGIVLRLRLALHAIERGQYSAVQRRQSRRV